MTSEAIVKRLKKTARKLSSKNAKSAVSARKHLSKAAIQYPAEFAAAGLNPADFPRHRCDVVKYGTVGKIIAVSTKNGVNEEMRAGHAYYNLLVAVCMSLLLKFKKLHSGPIQQQALKLTEKIEELYNKIGKVRQDAHYARIKKINPNAVEEAEPTIQKILTQIGELKADRFALTPAAYKEVAGMRKKNKVKIAEVDKGLLEAVKDARKRRPALLWFGNYLRVEDEFKKAIDAVKASPFFNVSILHSRYENREGEAPPDIMTWTAWNGEGALTTTLSNVGTKKTSSAMKKVSTVMEGTNSRFRLRPLQGDELAKFGLPSDYLERGGAKFVVAIRNTPPKEIEKTEDYLGWFEVPIIFHRPLGELDDEVLQASIIRKKVGLIHETSVHVCMKRLLAKVPTGTDSVTIIPKFERCEDGAIICCDVTKGQSTQPCVLPQEIEKALAQASNLDDVVTKVFGHAKEHILGSKEDGGMGLGNPDDPFDESKLTGILPEGLHIVSRKQMHHAARAWVNMQHKAEVGICRCETDRKGCWAGTKTHASIRDMRQFLRERHETVMYDASYEHTVALMTEKVVEAFQMQKILAEVLATLIVFDERFMHLYPWAANLRRYALRRRKDFYRNLVVQAAKDTNSLSYPDVDYRTRRPTPEKSLVAPSELVNVIENYASREGLKLVKIKVQPTSPPLNTVEVVKAKAKAKAAGV